MKRSFHSLLLALLTGTATDVVAQVEYEPIPSSILTADRVETRLGTLEFFDGNPDAVTVDVVYDNVDFQRGVRAFLDGSKTYSLTLPAGIPAKDFWSFVNYDPQTRSLLQTPSAPFPSVSSQSGTVQSNPDGSTTLWFGPEPPARKGSNWVPTVPGKGWFTVLRLYGPLEPWFDESWRLGELKPAD